MIGNKQVIASVLTVAMDFTKCEVRIAKSPSSVLNRNDTIVLPTGFDKLLVYFILLPFANIYLQRLEGASINSCIPDYI